MALIQIGRYKRPGFTPMDTSKKIQKIFKIYDLGQHFNYKSREDKKVY
jgi:hypothetical protein